MYHLIAHLLFGILGMIDVIFKIACLVLFFKLCLFTPANYTSEEIRRLVLFKGNKSLVIVEILLYLIYIHF